MVLKLGLKSQLAVVVKMVFRVDTHPVNDGSERVAVDAFRSDWHLRDARRRVLSAFSSFCFAAAEAFPYCS